MWANFRALIGIFSQSVGPSLAIWANPVQFSFRCFELFGYDFLLDFQGRAWLLEVNCSPALQPHNGDPWFSEVVAQLQTDIMKVGRGGPVLPYGGSKSV